MASSPENGGKNRSDNDTDFEKNIDDFAEEIGSIGKHAGRRFEKGMKQLGEELEQAGKRVERHADEWGDRWDTWWDRKFGVIGPLLVGFIWVIAFGILLEVLRLTGGMFPMLLELRTFFYTYVYVFIFSFFFFGYTSYLNRQVHHIFRFIAPVISAIAVGFIFWIMIHVFTIVDQYTIIGFLSVIADIMRLIFPVVILLVLVIGYFGVAFTTMFRKESHYHYREDEKETDPDKELTPEEVQQQEKGSYKHLYRSAQHRLLGGIAGGVGEYLDIDPVVIRVFFALGIIVSFGSLVLLYLFLWIIIPRNPRHNWKKE